MLLSSLVLAAALSGQTPDAPPAEGAITSADLARRQPLRPRRAPSTRAWPPSRSGASPPPRTTSGRPSRPIPSSAGPYFYLGYTYYKLAEKKRPFHPDKEKAREMFAKAYSIDPAFRPVWGEKAR